MRDRRLPSTQAVGVLVLAGGEMAFVGQPGDVLNLARQGVSESLWKMLKGESW